MPMTNELRELAFNRAPVAQIRQAAKASGMKNLVEDGILKIFNGITTPEEVAQIAQTEGLALAEA
jgi:type II secretory ATPase GspE/PulE/Tfp pilus assembly ATPase PilB-like protein